MKQLVDSCAVEGHVIVGCGNYAFTLLRKVHDGLESVLAYELVCSSITTTNSEDDLGEAIDAVSCGLNYDRTMLHCAVSREDKTISIYDIPTGTNADEGSHAQESVSQVLPRAIHKIAKRCYGLVVTSINDADQSCPTILLAADSCGDITAFPVTTEYEQDPVSTTTGNGKEKRLLLGHTASMITGIQLVTDYCCDNANYNDGNVEKTNQIQRQRILSSDRNGKVRVTSFPHTHIVEGYLLNHTSYITSMDATSHPNFGSLCLTSSGDGTLRLWDYVSCHQLAVFHHTDTEDVTNQDKSGVITNVSLQHDGRTCIYLCDGSLSIHVLNIHQSRSSSSPADPTFSFIQQSSEFQCPTQPIFAKILWDQTLLILLKEPTYFMHVKLTNNITNGTTILEDISHSSVLCKAIRQAALKYHINVPSSIFEFDDDGRIKKLSAGLGHSGRKHFPPKEASVEEEDEQNCDSRRSRRRRRKLREDCTGEKQQMEQDFEMNAVILP